MSNQSPRSPESPKGSRPSNGVALIVGAVVAAVVVAFVVIGVIVKDDSPGSPSAQQVSQKPTPTFESKPAGHTVMPTPPVSSPPATSPNNLPPLHCTKAPAPPGKGQQFAKPPKASLAQ